MVLLLGSSVLTIPTSLKFRKKGRRIPIETKVFIFAGVVLFAVFLLFFGPGGRGGGAGCDA